MSILQLNPPIPVTLKLKEVPDFIPTHLTEIRGWAYMVKETGIDSHRMWVVVLDHGGEVIDVPQPEIRVDPNWSYGRRY